MIKKIGKLIFKSLLRNNLSKIKKFVNNQENNTIEDIFNYLQNEKTYYYTYAKRPRNIGKVKYKSQSYSSNKIGIILQGQIKKEDNFTFQSIELYHKLYPNCHIILSTWCNEDNEQMNKLKKLNYLTIVESEYPKIAGHGHINYQRLNSRNGILKAKELGCEYVLKSRTDQRIYANNSILFLKSLIEQFPLKLDCKAKGRIAVCSLCTLKDRLYNICDMLLFGYTDDMLLYFSPDEAPKYDESFVIPNEETNPVGYAQFRPGEIYFATKYIENCGFNLEWTFEDSDYYRNNLFIVFNSESVDQFWPKYGSKEYLWRSYNSFPHEVVTFEDWFVNQSNL